MRNFLSKYNAYFTVRGLRGMHALALGGFTLIELLVVIAIIGILSAVVLASLSNARSRGTNAAVIGDLNAVQKQAEIYYSTNGTYNKVNSRFNSCTSGNNIFGDPTVQTAMAAATANAKGNAVYCDVENPALYGDHYVVEATLAGTTGNTQWCIDSTGAAKYEYTVLMTSGSACP